MTSRRAHLKRGAALLAWSMCVTSAYAQSAQRVDAGDAPQAYPTKPVRVIAASSGTSGDLLARYLAQRLSERWGQSVVVENRAGASAIIAAEAASKALPDGYTLHLGQLSSFGVAVSLHRKLPYDPLRDFTPITLFASVPSLLLGNAALPAGTFKAFLEYARARPGQINYASAGTGTTGNLTFELLNHAAGLKLVHIPYKGSGAALNAVIAGEVQVSSTPIPISFPHVKVGKVKGYAVTGKQRFAQAPEIPTVAEEGLPGFESVTWFGMLVPARTPAGLVRRLNVDMVDIINAPATRAWLVAQGAEPRPGTPEDFRSFIRSETAKWAAVIKTAGIKVE